MKGDIGSDRGDSGWWDLPNPGESIWKSKITKGVKERLVGKTEEKHMEDVEQKKFQKIENLKMFFFVSDSTDRV